MNNRDVQILLKVIDECRVIESLIQNHEFEVFSTDERTKRAVCMTLINIGELVKGLSEETKQANSQIPWRAISGLRDVTAHRYQTLRMEDIWETVKTDLPIFERQINELIQ